MITQRDNLLIEQFILNHPEDATDIIEKMSLDEILHLLETLPKDLNGKILSFLNISTAVQCLKSMTIEEVSEIMDTLPLNLAPTLMRQLPKESQNSILSSISKDKSMLLKRTLHYSEGTVGSIMDPFVFSVYIDNTVGDVLNLLKKQKDHDIHYLYILDRDYQLAGVLSINELFQSNSDQYLRTVMTTNVIKLQAEVNVKLILNHSGWNDHHVLPVVNHKNILQGVLRFKSLRLHEGEHIKKRPPLPLIAASSALGELYRLGISSLIQGASEVYDDSSINK
jgi:magnesium transporter